MIKLTKRLDEWITSKYSKFYLQRDDHYKLLAIDKARESCFDNTSRLLLIQAILDGEWEVEEPLYYVHLLAGEDGYLNIGKNSGFKWLFTKHESKSYITKFTRAEVEAIDPRYEQFLEEVE